MASPAQLQKLFLDLYALLPHEKGWLGYVFNIVLVAGGARTAVLFQDIDLESGVNRRFFRKLKALCKPFGLQFLDNYQGTYIYKRNKPFPKKHLIRRALEGDDKIIANFLDFICINEYPDNDLVVHFDLSFRDETDNFISYGCYEDTFNKHRNQFADSVAAYQDFADSLDLGIQITFGFMKKYRPPSLIKLLRSRKQITEEHMDALDNFFWNWGTIDDEPFISMRIIGEILEDYPELPNYRKHIKMYIPVWIEALSVDDGYMQELYDEDPELIYEWEHDLYRRHGMDL